MREVYQRETRMNSSPTDIKLSQVFQRKFCKEVSLQEWRQAWIVKLKRYNVSQIFLWNCYKSNRLVFGSPNDTSFSLDRDEKLVLFPEIFYPSKNWYFFLRCVFALYFSDPSHSGTTQHLSERRCRCWGSLPREVARAGGVAHVVHILRRGS